MSTHKCVEKRYDDIEKSQNDIRLYRGLVLSNKMKVLLISSPKTKKSIVTMDVHIGNRCDPNDLPGLAHLCEHLLFMGTEKYPKENDFDVHISLKNGLRNGHTFLNHTVYYFQIYSGHLECALDRFAQFFIAPLFTEISVAKEISAINLEFEKNAEFESFRRLHVEKLSASPDHPFSKFHYGNKKTLDVIPKQNGINVRNKLLEFFNKYYSANIMSLCVSGKESLDELENMVTKYFCEVPNKEVNILNWLDESPFKNEHFGTIWYMVPKTDIRELYISFPFPEMHNLSVPAFYISQLFEHRGKGSLFSALKARSWCNFVIAQVRFNEIQCITDLKFFDVIVDLTEEGINHIEDIVKLMFQYINMLKLAGPIEWFYNQCSILLGMNLPCTEMCVPSIDMFSTVRALHKYPMKEILRAQYKNEWRPDIIEQLMKSFTPQNVRIFVLAQAYESRTNETETWCDVKYKSEKIPKKIIDMWDYAGCNTDLKLPSKTDFDVPIVSCIKPDIFGYQFPTILENSPFIRLWYKKDNEFHKPEANMFFNFISPFAYMDPFWYNLTKLFVLLCHDSLAEYSARLSRFRWQLNDSTYGFTLIISGFDDKQSILLEKIMNQMFNLNIDLQRFEIIKEEYIRNLKDFDATPTSERAKYYLDALLEHIWLKEELLQFTANLSVNALQHYIIQLFSKMHVECLIYGNVTVEEALLIVKLIESKLITEVPHIKFLTQHELALHREIKLQDGCHFLFEAENKLHKNSYIIVYYRTGLRTMESNMYLELLAKIIEEPCNSILRFKESLGYEVTSGIRRTGRTQGLQILIQSDKHPQYVEERIDSFLDYMLDHISNMSDKHFKKYKKAVVTLHANMAKTLYDQSFLYWNQIETQQYNFDQKIEDMYLMTITRKELLTFFKENVRSKAKLSIHVIPTAMLTKKSPLDSTIAISDDSSINKNIKKIEDIKSFKNSQNLYPLIPFDKYFLGI